MMVVAVGKVVVIVVKTDCCRILLRLAHII